MLVGGVPTRCPHQVSPPGAPTMSGANFFVPPISSLKINQWSIFKQEMSGTKIFAGTWWGHLVGAPPTNMSPPAPAGDPPGYPPRRPGT